MGASYELGLFVRPASGLVGRLRFVFFVGDFEVRGYGCNVVSLLLFTSCFGFGFYYKGGRRQVWTADVAHFQRSVFSCYFCFVGSL